MEVTSTSTEVDAAHAERALEGLPATDYAIHVKPLRYRTKPHMSAWTDFTERTITLQVPEPFLPFGEVVAHGARRRPGKGMRFIWLTEGITITSPDEVLRFLYLHEWMHWYLRERLGRASQAETTCDRFALRNYRKVRVTEADARQAMKRGPRKR
ncbi:MAG TPA: hypothetical protein VE032_09780 [Actinomycetota bacterium]|nr:hypothetical protein [Actinomycetota bacterium]